MNEKDWKILRSKVPDWQEAFMANLIEEYKAILSEDTNPSDRFWKLEERLRTDQKLTGVQINMRRSLMIPNLLELLNEGAITLDDLKDFSEELQEQVAFLYEQ
ncbi:MAG: multidrug transporter [Erysipelotrichaceae bacterium]|nr:multidrug transporter [Erysipelotrichaceae bacterium]